MQQMRLQENICKRFGSSIETPCEDERVGIALATLSQLPLNALRHRAMNGTCGWYIWGGEISDDPEFFQSLHVRHLGEYAPGVVPFLSLSPGWRVLLGPGQTEVWHDPSLLSV